MDNTKDGFAVGAGHNEHVYPFYTSIPTVRGGNRSFASRAFHVNISWPKLSRPVDKRKLVYKARDGASKEWGNPVDPMIGPFACY